MVTLIYLNTESESEATRDEVKRHIDPVNLVNLGMGIRRVRKIKKGGVLMELENKMDYDKLEIELISNENLGENYTIRKAAKLIPRIIIYDISDELDEEDIVTGIGLQKDLPDEPELKIEFFMKGKIGKNVILSLKPEAFNYLIKKGRVNIRCNRYNLREFLRPICFKFGHLAKHCKSKKKCRNCQSETHEVKQCEHDTTCENCKIHNQRFNTNYNIHHSIRNKKCFLFENEILRLQNRIDYGSSN